VTVTDLGVGVPEAEADRLFTSFFRGSRTASIPGTGLGLFISRRIAEQHRGELRLGSSTPAGSTFVLTLPLTQREPTGSGLTASAAVVAHRRIVIVEDNIDALESLKQLLELDGHEVATATEGEAGRGLIASTVPDVAFIDVGLPQMDGYAVARAVRGDTRCANVSLVAVTGYGQVTDRERALAAGFDAHLVKPLDYTAVERLLAEPPHRADGR
jgi:CheY-like chemotaxis protein